MVSIREKNLINKAVEILKKDGVIVFPTDTVWGIGARIGSEKGIERLYKIKKREKDKPTAVLVGSVFQAHMLGEINQKAENLLKKYWPGALTIVVKAKKRVPESIQGEKRTVGLRMPQEEIIFKITKLLGEGLVTASANFSEQPAPTKKKLLDPELLKQVDLVLPGEAGGKLPSTVVDLTGEKPVILRQGEVVI